MSYPLAMPWKQVEPMNQKTEFVLKAIKTANFRELCREYEINTKTGYKWKERFLEHGLSGQGELSRRPKGHPKCLDEAVVCEIIRLKQRHRHWGPRKIRKVYEWCWWLTMRRIVCATWSRRRHGVSSPGS